MKTWRPTVEQLMCRDLRHTWEPFDAWKEGRGFIRVLKCSRCDSHRTQKLDSQGYVLTSSMKYSDGYVRKEGGRMTAEERADIRQLNVMRTLPARRGDTE